MNTKYIILPISYDKCFHSMVDTLIYSILHPFGTKNLLKRA